MDKLRSELRRPLSAARDALALPPSVTEREIEQMDETFEVRRPGSLPPRPRRAPCSWMIAGFTLLGNGGLVKGPPRC